MLEVRSYTPEDAAPLGQVFFRAVREGAGDRYSKAERAAWCQRLPEGPKWEERLASQEVVVAARDQQQVGFMTVALDKNYLDLAYVLPEEMGKGVAAAMYAVLMGRVKAAGLTWLYVDASHFARPFFEKQGWQLIRPQAFERDGQTLHNFRMEWHSQNRQETAA